MKKRAKVVEIDGLGAEELVAAAERGDPVLASRGGKPVAAVISVEALRALMNEKELLKRLALGEIESAGGTGEELETVLEDCRLLLEEN